MKKIMIIEDDLTIAQAIGKNLEAWGYGVYIAENYTKIVEEFTSQDPDLVLIDINLPNYNGYYWCQEIRKISQLPIIFLSSESQSINIVMAIDMGADDYINKPFDMEVLLAKIRAVLRRSSQTNKERDVLVYGDLTLSLLDMKLIYKEKEIDLSKNEFKILEILLREAGNIVSREDLMNRLWQSDEYIDDNTLTVNIARLRKTLEELGIRDLIKTKVGVGYYVQG